MPRAILASKTGFFATGNLRRVSAVSNRDARALRAMAKSLTLVSRRYLGDGHGQQ
jgi:hypothetical protein